MEIFDLSFGSWMLLGCLVASAIFIADLLTPKILRRFRRKKDGDPPCPMIECHNTSCDHYLSQYDVCRYTQYPIEDSVLRSWILRYVDANGVDKLYELISGEEAPHRSGGDFNAQKD